METKICNKCNIEKPLSDYHSDKRKKDGKVNQCRICVNNIKKISGSKKRADEKYYQSNKEKINQKNRNRYHEIKNDENFQQKRIDYYESKKEHFLDYKKSWYDKNKEQHLEKSKKWRAGNKQRVTDMGRIRCAERRKEDMMFKMIENIRTRVKSRIRNKSMTTETILGCDWNTFKKYIENQFLEGMTWENNGRGKDKWHYDHIIPLASAKTKEDLYKLNHYTNFKPLWEEDNLKKSDKISEEWGNA